jgi:hypothetical protein
MSKKQKRSVSRTSPTAPRSSGSSPTGTFIPVSEPRPVAPTRSATTEFNPDYSYIIKDLKRIGLLAGSFFVILIALSFCLK